MKIPKEIEIELRKFATQITCSKNLHCLESHYDNICNAKYDKDQALLICFEDLNSKPCKFAFDLDRQTVCNCKIRRMLYEIIT